MIRQLILGTFLSAVFSYSNTWGQSAREIVERGKNATALVEVESTKKSATATCIHSSGVFITNRHVVDGLTKEAKIRLTISPNQENQKRYSATVLRVDSINDLAVVKVTDGGDFAFLSLGEDAQLYETMHVTAFGYPFGKSLSVKEDSLPDISVNTGHITSLRRRDGKLQSIQMDNQLNPGNSGGPILDDKGLVIGVVSSGVFATGVNFAVPVSAVSKLVERPDVSVKLPTITEANQHDEAEFRVEVIPFLDELQDISVEFTLSDSSSQSRTFVAMRAEKNVYSVKAIPAVRPLQAPMQRLSATITFINGSVVGDLNDREVMIGDYKMYLSDIRTIECTPGWKVTRRDGTLIEGTPEFGEQPIRVDLGGLDINLDLSKAKSIHLTPKRKTEPIINYEVIVRKGAIELHRSTGNLGSGFVRSGAGASPTSAAYQGDRQIIDLPDLVADAILARGGQLILLYLPKMKKIAVYDVNQARIVRYLSVSGDSILLAAGQEKLFIVEQGNRLIERWSLETFERETTRMLSLGVIKSITLGYASSGPLLIHGADSTDALSQTRYQFFNVETLQPFEMQAFRLNHTSFRDFVHIRASATGDVFGFWCTSHSPQGMESLRLEGNIAKSSYQHDSAGHIVPNFDGTAIATGLAGICTVELNQTRQRTNQTIPVIPSTHPRFYMTVPTDPGAQINLGAEPFKGILPTVRLIDSEQDLVQLPSFDLGGTGTSAGSWASNDFTLDKRVYYIQQADQIVSIPYSNNKLIVQRFNLKDALDKKNIDYLFVTSAPPLWFEKGTMFRYLIQAESRRGLHNYELASGPDGMVLSPKGELAWDVPVGFAGNEINVIVTVSSIDGQRVNHAFKSRLRSAL